MTDEKDPKTIWPTVIFGLAVFLILMGVAGLFSPVRSQPTNDCASMTDIHNTMLQLNSEPEPKGLEWFEHLKQAFANAGYVFNEWPEDLEDVFVVVSRSNGIVMIGYVKNGYIINTVSGIRLEIYEAVIAQMERERM